MRWFGNSLSLCSIVDSTLSCAITLPLTNKLNTKVKIIQADANKERLKHLFTLVA